MENGTAQFKTLNANTETPAEQFYVGNNLGDVDLGNKRGALKFFTGTTEKMRISSNGNVNVSRANSGGDVELRIQNSAVTSGDTASLRFSVTSNSAFDSAFIGSDRNNALILGSNAVERLRINNIGNVGIGVTNPLGKLEIKGNSGVPTVVHDSPTTSDSSYSVYQVGNSSGWEHGMAGAGDTYKYFFSYGTFGPSNAKVTFTNTGNVGIGDSTPQNAKLVVSETGGSARFAIKRANSNTTGTVGQLGFQNSTSYYVSGITAIGDGDNNGSHLLFHTTSDAVSTDDNVFELEERMRITSGGSVYIGNQGNLATENGWVLTPSGGGGVTANFSGTNEIFAFNQRDGSGTTKIDFRNGNVGRGNITWTTSGTSFNTSSDYRLKENVVEMTGALDRVDALKPSRFNFIADPEKTVDGFIAHEVQAIVPEAVTGEKDAVEEYEVTPAVLDDEGNVIEEAVMGTRPIYQGIDQSKLVPLLTAAIKELKDIVDQ